jgi:hypothetical protein
VTNFVTRLTIYVSHVTFFVTRSRPHNRHNEAHARACTPALIPRPRARTQGGGFSWRAGPPDGGKSRAKYFIYKAFPEISPSFKREHVFIPIREHATPKPPAALTPPTRPYIIGGMDTPDDMTDELSRGGRPQDLGIPHVGARPPQKVRYTHDAVIDMIIANPAVSQGQLAMMFGYTQAWMSTIMSSDAFKARLANRRAELVDPAIIMSVEEKFTALTEKSLEVLMTKLSQPATQVPDNLALRAAELGAKVRGQGGFAPAQTAGDSLAGLANRLVALRGAVYSPEGKPIVTVEGECHEQDQQSKAA